MNPLAFLVLEMLEIAPTLNVFIVHACACVGVCVSASVRVTEHACMHACMCECICVCARLHTLDTLYLSL